MNAFGVSTRGAVSVHDPVGGGKGFSLESLAGALIFAFPLFAVSLRHWVSIIFVVLAVLGLIAMWQRGRALWQVSSREWWLIALVIAFFAAFLAASLANGWNEHATKGLDKELRFLLVLPLYLLLRRIPKVGGLFALGCLIAVCFNLGLVYYETHHLGLTRADGVYGPLFLGPVTVIFAAIVAQSLSTRQRWLTVSVILFVILAAAMVAAYSSRSALLGLLILVLLLVLTRVARFRLWILLATVVLGVLGLQFSELAKSRLQEARGELMSYLVYELDQPGAALNPHGDTPVGVRLEMLRAAGEVLNESPWFGVGRGGYHPFVTGLAAEGQINPVVSDHSHPHNLFAETLFSKGVVGLVILLALLAYAVWFFWNQRSLAPRESWAGLTFLAVLLSTQMTESAMVNKGNFIAIFLIGLMVLFAAKQAAIEALRARADRASKDVASS